MSASFLTNSIADARIVLHDSDGWKAWAWGSCRGDRWPGVGVGFRLLISLGLPTPRPVLISLDAVSLLLDGWDPAQVGNLTRDWPDQS